MVSGYAIQHSSGSEWRSKRRSRSKAALPSRGNCLSIIRSRSFLAAPSGDSCQMRPPFAANHPPTRLQNIASPAQHRLDAIIVVYSMLLPCSVCCGGPKDKPPSMGRWRRTFAFGLFSTSSKGTGEGSWKAFFHIREVVGERRRCFWGDVPKW